MAHTPDRTRTHGMRVTTPTAAVHPLDQLTGEEDRSLDGEDIMLWRSFGPTHIPRTEDWPVMPVDYSGAWVKPHGFLDQSPAMDLPADARSPCGAKLCD